MPGGTISLTDIYGTLVSSRLLIPTDLTTTSLDPRHLSLSHFRRSVDNGLMPMPIFTAISRELPEPLGKKDEEVREERNAEVNFWQRRRLERVKRKIEEEARWLWL